MSGSDLKLDHSNAETHTIKKVQFGISSEEEIVASSVVEVNSTVIYNKETGLPAENGINDPRMGVTTRGIVCQSCFGEMKQCPGHHGHIKLAEPVYHIGFMNMVLKVLRCVSIFSEINFFDMSLDGYFIDWMRLEYFYLSNFIFAQSPFFRNKV